MILDNPKVTQKEMAEELNITIRAVKKSIKEMQEKNILERIGSARGGYWKFGGRINGNGNDTSCY